MSTPEILLFARGLLSLLDLWPALTIAVREEWGGPESADKKTWLASEIIDTFEGAVVATPAGPAMAADCVAEPPMDVDQLADLLTQVMSDEFEAAIEDGSVDPLAADVLRLWADVVAPSVRSAEETVSALERKAAEVSRKPVAATSGGGPVDEDGEEWEDDEDSDDEGDDHAHAHGDADDAPMLVERQEPVVDDDGFTLVQKPRRR
jgi:pre-rRNA-processing protein TSR2